MIKLVYIIGINLLAFFLMGYDKHCAKNNLWRISEYHLLGIAFIGGSLGEIIGMFTFHHKTKQPHFRILLPIFLILNILLYIKALH